MFPSRCRHRPLSEAAPLASWRRSQRRSRPPPPPDLGPAPTPPERAQPPWSILSGGWSQRVDAGYERRRACCGAQMVRSAHTNAPASAAATKPPLFFGRRRCLERDAPSVTLICESGQLEASMTQTPTAKSYRRDPRLATLLQAFLAALPLQASALRRRLEAAAPPSPAQALR